nr:immunoglobulin heavy chain junction region [Mus musculus]MBK4187604.1 immunoglobulin heavy chain junction region [Mus musculus]MBK4187605.1 immunoglobulin heavy chain junction region [Mus musculus]MBK4187606.1 immunoglobulin heavy chain junction region [Mus musculus]MBK4187614.1 immunoglobulin heavy chain junction region [Mus musculus]
CARGGIYYYGSPVRDFDYW